MMANYPYIIAGFPDLLLDFEQHSFNVDAVIDEVKGQLSESDAKLVDWLEFGLEGSHLTSHFYRNIRQTRNDFLMGWFDFDHKLRLAKVAYIHGKPYQEEFPEIDKADRIFKTEDLFQREKQLDQLYWDKAAELVQFDIFNLDIILSLLVRLHIADRWNRLEPSTGAQLFKQLVDEVRGTSKESTLNKYNVYR